MRIDIIPRLLLLALLLSGIALQPGLAANRLAGHPSPYLALHGNDPVDWRPWQAEVFAEAAKDNRLVLVSVGYFSCHWCHVMQRESYQDEAVASMLNRHYVSVKVDRELDPDLDQRLIGFVERVRGSAGWPLNVFLTPEGYPLTGFTYLPRDNFHRLLGQLEAEWRENHVELSKAAKRFFEQQIQDDPGTEIDAPQLPAGRLLGAFVAQSMLAADQLQGGFGDTSKFPNVPQLDALLEVIAANEHIDPDVVDFVRLTLDVMSSSNLSDHLNGGFFRYTVDPDWQTPHYEKMLYDNAQLASLYLRAHELWPKAGYAHTAQRTLDFVEAELKHPQGGYMSSLSAVDEDNIEGGAYLWDREQLEAALSRDELKYLKNLWQLETIPNDFLPRPLDSAIAGGDADRNQAILKKLRTQNRGRMPPDDKRLASWNAMLLDALTLAADRDIRFEKRARGLYQFMRKEFFLEDRLIRFAGNPEVASAVLEDYTEVAIAFYRYGRQFDDQDAVERARILTETAHAYFLQDGRWRQKTDSLIPVAPGQWIMADQVFRSPMSLWIEAALNIPGVDGELRDNARQMLQRANRELVEAPYFYGSFILLRERFAG